MAAAIRSRGAPPAATRSKVAVIENVQQCAGCFCRGGPRALYKCVTLMSPMKNVVEPSHLQLVSVMRNCDCECSALGCSLWE